MRKVYVDVIIKQTKEGGTIPIKIIWEDGRSFDIDKVIDKRKAASLKAGGRGVRYLCRIMNNETCLWQEEDKWFVEAK